MYVCLYVYVCVVSSRWRLSLMYRQRKWRRHCRKFALKFRWTRKGKGGESNTIRPWPGITLHSSPVPIPAHNSEPEGNAFALVNASPLVLLYCPLECIWPTILHLRRANSKYIGYNIFSVSGISWTSCETMYTKSNEFFYIYCY